MELKVGDTVRLDTIGVVTRVGPLSIDIKFDGCRHPNNFSLEDSAKFTVVEQPPKVGDLVENDITSDRFMRRRGILLHIFDPPVKTPGGLNCTGIILQKNGLAFNVYTKIRKVSE